MTATPLPELTNAFWNDGAGVIDSGTAFAFDIAFTMNQTIAQGNAIDVFGENMDGVGSDADGSTLGVEVKMAGTSGHSVLVTSPSP
jgi:hypothetical protein